jgi:prevent-host-death family protein
MKAHIRRGIAMAQSAKSIARTVPSDDGKRNWEAMVEAASEGEDIVVEMSGEAKSVLISYEEYREYQALRNTQRRNEILERLEAFERRQAERNKDLSDEEIEELADRATREAFDELAAEGKLVF